MAKDGKVILATYRHSPIIGYHGETSVTVKPSNLCSEKDSTVIDDKPYID